MPTPSTARATAPASLTTDQRRALAEIEAHPGHYTAESLAAAHGWDLRLTQQDVRELRRRGLLHLDTSVVLRPGVCWESVPAGDFMAQLVVLAIIDGHRTVAQIEARLRDGRVRGTVERMVRAGLVWPLRRLVAR